MINSGCERLFWVADANESRHLRCDPVRFLLMTNEMTKGMCFQSPLAKPITVAPLPSAAPAQSIAGRYREQTESVIQSLLVSARVWQSSFLLASAQIIRRFSWGQQARADCSRAVRFRLGTAVACHL